MISDTCGYVFFLLLLLLVPYIESDNGMDMNVIRLVAEEMARPLPNYFDMQRNDQKARNENYYEETIPRYTNDLFKEHFRMSRASFEILTNIIGNAMEHNENDPVPLQKKILFSIWVLAKQESFLSVGDRFGFSKSTGHGIFTSIIEVLANLMPQFIKWPENVNYETISRIFEIRSNGFPGVIGVIDGCHIPCKQPIGNPVDFYNRKGFHSIILQGICDHTMKFTDVILECQDVYMMLEFFEIALYFVNYLIFNLSIIL